MPARLAAALLLTLLCAACSGQTRAPLAHEGGPVSAVTPHLSRPAMPPGCVPRTPPSGAAPGTNELMPGSTRLRIATSTDGRSFTRNDITVLDQAATPSFTQSPNRPPMLYYTAHNPDGRGDAARVSIGSEDGTTWVHCELTFNGFPSGVRADDPDVVERPDGTLRMYFTGPVLAGGMNTIGIHFADSGDGFAWTYGGVAFSRPEGMMDSMTCNAGDASWQYALSTTGIAMVRGRSTDGDTFALVDIGERTMNGQPYVLSQAIARDGAIAFFGHGPNGAEIRSLTTTDCATFAPDSTLALRFDLNDEDERKFIKDPAVTHRPNGLWIMAYATAIP